MACDVLKTATGRAIVCSRGRRKPAPRCACGAIATRQCDGPKPGGKTCDAFLCGWCSSRVRALDYCGGCAHQLALQLEGARP